MHIRSRIAQRLNTSQRVVGYLVIGILVVFMNKSAGASGPFPQKPITIIVYTSPGGLIDMTARKFMEIAKRYTDLDVTMVPKYKTGSGGITAIEHVLQSPSDGHTLLACTKSNIAKIVQSNRQEYVDELDWIAMMVADPECIITRSKHPPTTLQELIDDAKARPGEQIWLGPAMGGLDHVTALKVWESFGIEARWIPYASGGEAKASLMGREGVAYVGNPRDAVKNNDLHIAVVSSPKRLAQFPDTPVFSEFGVEGLDNEFMWRGFAVRRGCPPEALRWYDELFRAVSKDKDWRRFWEKDGIDVEFRDTDAFTKIVKNDRDQFAHYLQRITTVQPVGSAQPNESTRDRIGTLVPMIVILANVALVIGLILMGRANRIGHYLIPSAVLSLGILCYTAAIGFTSPARVGAATIPKLWAALMIPVALLLVARASKSEDLDENAGDNKPQQTLPTWGFIGLVIVYVMATVYVGYFIATFVFLVTAMYALGLRQPPLSIAVATAWVGFAYVMFTRMLQISPPVGSLFERFL